jgi:hypothetical protein
MSKGDVKLKNETQLVFGESEEFPSLPSSAILIDVFGVPAKLG